MARLQPAPAGGGFRRDGWWVWGGSPIRGEDGRFHLFASCWPKRFPFFEGYIAYSRVVRAVSDSPAGPYTYVEEVLPPRGSGFWDGRMTHNPTIRRCGDRYLLFYIGATHDGPDPSPEELGIEQFPPVCNAIYRTVRIGMAVADSVAGPWRRPERPVLQPRPEKWDNTVVTNPAPVVLEDGRILLYYRSNTPRGLRLGVAAAAGPDAPFERLRDDPVLQLPGGNFVEDPFVWRNDGRYEMLAKDMTGGITGEQHAGVHALSPDALDWRLAPQPKAWSKRIRWDDGSETVQGALERPQLLFDQSGAPTHLFAATADGPGGFRNAKNTWTLAVPLR
ncbi:MAG: glycosyl hydrolase family 43 [Kiritimatiellaeota bacterium]|nr:glycosyl hydrolase family 43 [Kiritimatiellota bacterium]